MIRKNIKFYSLILILIDTLVLLGAFTIAYVARVQYDPRPLLSNIHAYDYLRGFLVIIPFWILIFASLGLYQAGTYNRRLVEWSKILLGTFIGILLIIGWQYATDKDILPARLVAVYGFVGSFILIVVEREILRAIRTLMFKYGRGVRRVLLIGSSGAASDIARNLADTSRSGYEVVAIAGPKKILPDELHIHHYSLVETALRDIELNEITTIIQTDLYEATDRNQKILNAAQTHHIDYSFIPGESEFYSGKNTVDIFLGYPMISVYQTPLVGWGAILKRIVDLLVVIIFSPIWVPIFIILCILQKLFNRGPIFFKNTRLGQYGKVVNIYKFRSMKPEQSGQDAIAIFKKMGRDDLVAEYTEHRKVTNDPRITKMGKFLRATSIDETAQILNIIRGEMSLVGPRPILPDEKAFYKNRGPLLFSVKPGITGLWQVSGRSDLSFDERVELELFYAQNWTWWLDIKIFFKTILVVLRKRGAK